MSWASATRNAVIKPVQQFARPKFKIEQVDFSRLVALDFETYYDVDYTLSKLSTSEYIRDSRFEALMVGIKIGKKKRVVVPGPKVAAYLRTVNWVTHSLLCHNMQFDGFILSHHYQIIPKRYYCSLSMARGLHSNEIGAGLDEVALFYGRSGKLKGTLETMKGHRYKNLVAAGLYAAGADYCGVDVDEMLGIFTEMVAQVPVDEMDLIDLTCRMFCDPVLRVDLPRVQVELTRELDRRKVLLTSLIDTTLYEGDVKFDKHEKLLTGEERVMLITKKVVGSNEKFADLLRHEGVEPPVKISPAWMKKPADQRKDEDKWAYAFAKDDADFINLPDDVEVLGRGLNLNHKADVKKLAARQARLRALVDCRIAVKSTTNITRAQRFLTAGAGGMRLPVGYAYYRAHTGRWGGNNKMNMQNLTRGGELRLSILAAAGHVLCVADSGQIEARVNGWLWGQDDLMDAFRAADAGLGLDAYCLFAALIYGREITKADKTERFVGKVCVAGDTRVLTNHGVKPIVEVRSNDLLWDGNSWVQHDGLIQQGVKQVLRTQGFAATSDHGILTGHGWQEWSAVLTDPSLFQSALSSATSQSSVGTITHPRKENSGVIARYAAAHAGLKTWCTQVASGMGIALDATFAQKWPLQPSGTGSTNQLCRTTSTVVDCSTGCQLQYHGAPTRAMLRTSITDSAAYRWLLNGVKIGLHSFATFKRCQDGTSSNTKWTDATPVGTTNPTTSGSSASQVTSKTSVALKTSNSEFVILNETTQTYDLANAGPNHRFTVLTDAGPLIVHNCVLGLGYGMGAAKLQLTLAKGALGGPPVFFMLDQCQRIINTYRRQNAKIKAGWDICKAIIEDMAAGRTGSYGPINWEANTIWLPNGMALKYPNLKKSIGDKGWDEWTYQSGAQRKKIYGGLLCENLVQALARIIVACQMLTINRKYRVVMTTHDEAVAHVKARLGPAATAFMLKVMQTPLEWCTDIPLNAEAGFDVNYSK